MSVAQKEEAAEDCSVERKRGGARCGEGEVVARASAAARGVQVRGAARRAAANRACSAYVQKEASGGNVNYRQVRGACGVGTQQMLC